MAVALLALDWGFGSAESSLSVWLSVFSLAVVLVVATLLGVSSREIPDGSVVSMAALGVLGAVELVLGSTLPGKFAGKFAGLGRKNN